MIAPKSKRIRQDPLTSNRNALINTVSALVFQHLYKQKKRMSNAHNFKCVLNAGSVTATHQKKPNERGKKKHLINQKIEIISYIFCFTEDIHVEPKRHENDSNLSQCVLILNRVAFFF